MVAFVTEPGVRAGDALRGGVDRTLAHLLRLVLGREAERDSIVRVAGYDARILNAEGTSVRSLTLREGCRRRLSGTARTGKQEAEDQGTGAR
jgi:hypothetical protein